MAAYAVQATVALRAVVLDIGPPDLTLTIRLLFSPNASRLNNIADESTRLGREEQVMCEDDVQSTPVASCVHAVALLLWFAPGAEVLSSSPLLFPTLLVFSFF